MGYNTYYKIEIIGESLVDNLDHIKSIQESSGYSLEEECTWYSHEIDLIIYSKKYPETIFKLNGEGEESGDLWTKYFKNGIFIEGRGKIVYPTFNRDKFEFEDHLINKE